MLRLLAVLSAVGLTGCQAFGEKSYKVPSPSMEPTLRAMESITVDTDKKHPKIGDIVVFHPPRQGTDETLGSTCGRTPTPDKIRRLCAEVGTEDPSETFVKRVVAVGGDPVALRGGALVRNGRLVDEPFIRRCAGDPASDCELPKPVTLPPGSLYVLGDNRGESADSRYWGPIRQEWVIGTVER